MVSPKAKKYRSAGPQLAVAAPAEGLPEPPGHLSERSQELWRATVSAYALDEAWQRELLRRACEAMDRADEARAVLAADGLTVIDRYDQLKPHPCVNVERDARFAVARLFRELGLDPAPRDYARAPRLGSAPMSPGVR